MHLFKKNRTLNMSNITLNFLEDSTEKIKFIKKLAKYSLKHLAKDQNYQHQSILDLMTHFFQFVKVLVFCGCVNDAHEYLLNWKIFYYNIL